MSSNETVLTAKSKLFISKATCKNLADKPEDSELIQIACGATGLDVQIAEAEKVDIATLCDSGPKSRKGFDGESTATLPMFYSSVEDSAYVEMRKAAKKGDSRYMRWESNEGGGEEFIAYVSSHNFGLQLKGVTTANMSLVINEGPEQITIPAGLGD